MIVNCVRLFFFACYWGWILFINGRSLNNFAENNRDTPTFCIIEVVIAVGLFSIYRYSEWWHDKQLKRIL